MFFYGGGRYLCKVMREHKAFKVYMIIGDQAFQWLVLDRTLSRPRMFGKVVPFMDWFHALCWTLCGVWQLCREPCLLWFVRMLEHDYLGKKEIFLSFNIRH